MPSRADRSSTVSCSFFSSVGSTGLPSASASLTAISALLKALIKDLPVSVCRAGALARSVRSMAGRAVVWGTLKVTAGVAAAVSALASASDGSTRRPRRETRRRDWRRRRGLPRWRARWQGRPQWPALRPEQIPQLPLLTRRPHKTQLFTSRVASCVPSAEVSDFNELVVSDRVRRDRQLYVPGGKNCPSGAGR